MNFKAFSRIRPVIWVPGLILSGIVILGMAITGAQAQDANQYRASDVTPSKRIYLLSPWRFLSDPGVWTTKESMPTGRGSLGFASASNGKMYAVGGHSGSVNLSTVEEYDPATNAWTTRTNLPTVRNGALFVAGGNGKLYAIGGHWTAGFLSTVEEYDPATNIWTTKANMPTARIAAGAAKGSNGKIYVAGGTNAKTWLLTTVEEYDPATDVWTTKASLPTMRRQFGLATAGNGKIYAVGGIDYIDRTRNSGIVYLNTVEEYDPATNAWTTKPNMPISWSDLSLAAAGNGKLYLVGGLTEGVPSWTSFSRMEEYDPATNTWTTKSSLSIPRYSMGVAAANNGKIYAVGGYGISGPVRTTLEEFDPVLFRNP